MDRNRSIQFNFGMEAIPILFHSQTNEFMKHLEKDGMKFLRFWWDHVGDQLAEEKRVSPAGLTYEVERLDEKTKMVTLSMPTPHEDREPYFVCLIARPERRLLWVRLPTTLAFALVRDEGSQQAQHTSFGYLTPNGIFRPRGVGLNPTKQDFKRIVKSMVEKEKKKAWWKK